MSKTKKREGSNKSKAVASKPTKQAKASKPTKQAKEGKQHEFESGDRLRLFQVDSKWFVKKYSKIEQREFFINADKNECDYNTMLLVYESELAKGSEVENE